MSRIIKDRNNRPVYMHKPIGVSNTKKAAYLSIGEVLKKTSIVEQQKMIENSPLYDEFKAGTPIESLDLLDYIDLSIQPIDFTDAEMLRNIARSQVEKCYQEFQKREEAARTQSAGTAQTPDVSPGASPASL